MSECYGRVRWVDGVNIPGVDFRVVWFIYDVLLSLNMLFDVI